MLGINKPTKLGGLGLDYSYQLAFSEELGTIESAGVSMRIGVQSDMATHALAKHGSDALREKVLALAISGDKLCR